MASVTVRSRHAPARRWVALVALAAAVAAIVLVFLPLTAAYDLDVFLRAGRAVAEGSRVYPRVAAAEVWSGAAFVYPYFAALPFALLSSLPPETATALFFALSAGAVVAAAWAVGRPDPWIPVVALCTSFTVTGLQLGALSPLLLAGVLALWRLRERPVAFALIGAPVVASKLFLLPLLAWPLLAGRRRAAAWTGLGVAALLGAGFALGPIGPSSYARMLAELGRHEARQGFGLVGALINLGAGPTVAQAVPLAVAAGVLAATAVRRDEPLLFAAGLVASLVVSPVVWSHYLALLVAAVVVLRPARPWLALLALASWAIAPPHGLRVDTDLIEGIPSSGTWLVVAAAALALWRRTGGGRSRSEDAAEEEEVGGAGLEPATPRL